MPLRGLAFDGRAVAEDSLSVRLLTTTALNDRDAGGGLHVRSPPPAPTALTTPTLSSLLKLPSPEEAMSSPPLRSRTRSEHEGHAMDASKVSGQPLYQSLYLPNNAASSHSRLPVGVYDA